MVQSTISDHIERRFLALMIDEEAGQSRLFGIDIDIDDFTTETRRDLWRVVSGMCAIGQADPFLGVCAASVLNNAARVLGRAPENGFVNELEHLLNGDGAETNNAYSHISEYAKALKLARKSRDMQRVVSTIQNSARENAINLVGHMEELRTALETEVMKDTTKGRPARVTLSESIEVFKSRRLQKPLTFGLMDYTLGRGTLTVMAGARKSGKTLVMLNRLLSLARAGEPSLFFSIEMTQEQIDARIGAFLTGIEYTTYEHGKATDEELDELREARIEARWTENAIIDYRKQQTLESLEAAIRLWQLKRSGLHLVAIDYDQLVQHPRGIGVSMAESADALYRGLGSLAKRMNIALVVLAQLRNDAVNSLVPNAENVYGGVNPAAKADAVLVLHCPEDAHFEAEAYKRGYKERLLRICVDIQRSGPGNVSGWFTMQPRIITVEELDKTTQRNLELELRAAMRTKAKQQQQRRPTQ